MENSKQPFRVAYIPTGNAGQMYWRIWNFAQALRKLPDVEVAVFCWQPEMETAHPWMQDCYHNRRIAVEIKDLIDCADITIVQVIYTSRALETVNKVKRKDKPLLMELDDYVMNVPRFNASSGVYFPNSRLEGIATSQMRMSDGMIVSTPYLKERCLPYNPNIEIAENCMETPLWEAARRTMCPHEGIRIGWIGGGTHSEDLEMVWPAIKEILEKYPQVDFFCIHGIPNFLKKEKSIWHDIDKNGPPPIGRPAERVFLCPNWRHIEEYPSFMASFNFDIGIGPLLDCAFNRAKSNLRWLEYSALGIPSVCSNISHFTETITDGENGFLADTTGEWIGALSRLIENAWLRESVGKVALEKTRVDFNVDIRAPKILEILKGMVEKHDQVRA